MFAVLSTYRLDGDLSCAFVASALVFENNLEVAHVVHRARGDEKCRVSAVKADQATFRGLDLFPVEIPDAFQAHEFGLCAGYSKDDVVEV